MKAWLQKTAFVFKRDEVFQPFGAVAHVGRAAAGLVSLSGLLMENIPLLCSSTRCACCISTRLRVNRSDFGWKVWGLFEARKNTQRCDFIAVSSVCCFPTVMVEALIISQHFRRHRRRHLRTCSVSF